MLLTPAFRDAMNQLGVTSEFESMVQDVKAYKQAEDNQTRAATSVVNPSLVAARKFVRLCIEQCNSWLANRCRKEPQVVELMVHRWNEIFTTLTAEAHARETREANEKADKEKRTVSFTGLII